MKHTLIAATLALAAGTVALPAFAAAPDAPVSTQPAPASDAQPGPRGAMMFWFLDRNNDGFIDQTEIAAFRTAKFQSLDTNGDGVLSKDEAIASINQRPMHGERRGKHAERFAARAEKRESRMLTRLGFSDTTTTITLAAFVAQDDPMFKRADTNGDGKVSKEEFLAAATKMPHP
ncbi:EF-hand domain-containing protein [Kaistia dalseonensis]|uniref:Ca2+-binding EF-hand superfamily protein n=1 Tax=Kaistia dalseonensis TaxID=410840 RepID=A0ABU0H8A8_9HYPH|nr:EF-hand domain-containing protein [Kaistia dalseonensis]MCX5495939.1 EF-hand domain-containing protein [Kaistia dalseonensis]MDQ0438542.1 Ca2+-binding EF-hand superfamily protein [Kaistia dalseonensis]